MTGPVGERGRGMNRTSALSLALPIQTLPQPLSSSRAAPQPNRRPSSVNVYSLATIASSVTSSEV